MPPSRRQVLALLATGAASLAGCMQEATTTAATPGDTGGPTTSSNGAGTNTWTPTPTTKPENTPTPTTTIDPGTEPPTIETPAPGGCDASGLPTPESVPAEYQDDLSSASYPDKPAMEREVVAAFLQEFEHAYWTNRIIENGPQNQHDDVDVDPQVDPPEKVAVRVRPVEDGYVAFTGIWLAYVYEPITETPVENGTERPTPTPLPTAPQAEAAAYYVTDRFLMRQSPKPDTEYPSITGGEVVQCW